MTGSKRFISGAVCPSCQAVDRIVIETLAADEGLDPILVGAADLTLLRACDGRLLACARGVP